MNLNQTQDSSTDGSTKTVLPAKVKSHPGTQFPTLYYGIKIEATCSQQIDSLLIETMNKIKKRLFTAFVTIVPEIAFQTFF